MLDAPNSDDPRTIDTHGHHPIPEFLKDEDGQMLEDAANKFAAEIEMWNYDQMAAEYYEANVGRSILLG
jgi:hypothetical protein